jgi:hypothetical protein
VVRVLQAEGVIQREINRRPLSVCGQNVPGRKVVSVCCNNDPETHGGRPRAVYTNEYCVIADGLIREDRKGEYRLFGSIVVMLQTGRSRVRYPIG